MREDKTQEIFRELVCERAERLQPAYVLRDVQEKITSALLKEGIVSDPRRAKDIAFHLTDWQADAAFLVALALFPERYSKEEITEGIGALLAHIPAHVVEAATLTGYPIENNFRTETE